MLILHSKYSPESIAFVEAYGESNTVIDWYNSPQIQLQYLLSGLPQPSAFPYVVYQGQGFINPENPQWVKDEVKGLHETEQEKLNKLTKLSKLKLSRALKDLGRWSDVKQLIKSNETFEDDWSNSVEIDLNDPVFLQGFSLVDPPIDMNEVKRIILGL